MKNFWKKWDNFWYHYKWHVIFTVFFLSVFLICTVQCMQKEDPDAMILYSGPSVLTAEGRSALGKILSGRLEEDHNGDGNKIVSLTDVVILSDAQIKEREEAAKEEGDSIYYDPTTREPSFNQVKNWLVSGEMMIAILDPFVYERFSSQALFVPLAEIYGGEDAVPSAAYDACAVSLDQLDFVEYNPAMKEAFAGAVICLIKPTVTSMMSGNDGEAWYNAHLSLFRRIVDFEVVD